MEYIRVTKENLEKEHICCAISNNNDVQVSSKKAWLADRFDEGLVFLKSVERGKCFIEYMRGKSIVGIGSAQGILSVDAEECQFNIDCEGARAIGVGGLSAESSLRIADCTGRISVSTSSGMAVMAAPDMLTAEGTQPEQIKNG